VEIKQQMGGSIVKYFFKVKNYQVFKKAISHENRRK
jgi:hypothetical protein